MYGAVKRARRGVSRSRRGGAGFLLFRVAESPLRLYSQPDEGAPVTGKERVAREAVRSHGRYPIK